ncbi:MAG: tetratricopeptide repeat protein [Sedimentisphaerales bacterium]|jgi:tetratricopeptide (TPR) repeat protein|nr:tetratricopeptide repeat protein [Sedimentisphaerales bacterium]
MWKTIALSFFVVVVGLGCRLDTGPLTTTAPIGGTSEGGTHVVSQSEVELVEKVQQHRQAYGQALQMLVDYYSRVGNKRQLEQARSELDAFKTMPQYTYIADVIPGPELRATTRIEDADRLYLEALRLHREANALVLLPDRIYQRRALDAYKRLISRFPNSDKIGDAAFQIGTIYEDMKDYQAALTYYQRAYQWDPQTERPARFKAAYILDRYLHQKDQAVEAYKLALESEGVRHPQWKQWAESRLEELSKQQ